jgi:tetratricopeptide (TPR) repeat protein
MKHSRLVRSACALALLIAGIIPGHSTAVWASSLERARQHLAAGEPGQALELLDDLIGKARRPNAELLLARSEARFMLSDPIAGRADLERAVEVDPELRAAWLTLGALEISQRRYEQAIRCFERARDLDPEALDSDLNLGAAHLLGGDEEQATKLFDKYLVKAPDPLGARLLVAKNFAVAGQAERAIDLLEQAVELDERSRIALRTDPSFESLLESPRFQRLLETDSYAPPASHHKSFFRLPDESYEIQQGRVLGAVIDALRKSNISFDARIEVTPTWSLIWGDLRVKVSLDPQRGGSRVDLSASPDRYEQTAFQELSKRLYQQVLSELAPVLPLG